MVMQQIREKEEELAALHAEAAVLTRRIAEATPKPRSEPDRPLAETTPIDLRS